MNVLDTNKLIDLTLLGIFKEEIEKVIAAGDKSINDKLGVLPSKVGETDITTWLEYINAKIEEVNSDATTLEGRVEANEDAIALLNNNAQTVGSVDYKIAEAFKAFTTEMSDDQVVNTFKELLDYAAKHKGEYTDLITLVGSLPEDAGVTTIVAYIEKLAAAAQKEADDRIKAIEDDYLKAADKTELEGKVTAEKERAEAAEKANKDAIDAINHETTGILAQAKADATSKANTAEQNAKDYADGLADNYDENGAAKAVQGETTETVASVDAKVEALTMATADEVKALFTPKSEAPQA